MDCRALFAKAALLASILVLSLSAGVLGAEVKDATPPSGNGASMVSDCPGPDGFGYTCGQMDCPFQFIDISGTGTLVVSGDDVQGNAAIQPFQLYGTTYTQLAMNTNGFLSTDIGGPPYDLSNDCPLPQTPSTGGGARIYALHDDLVSDGYVQYFTVCPRPGRFGSEPCTVFLWHARHYGGSTYWLQEAILYHNTNDIAVQIGPGNPEQGSGSTTGIQNETATIGLTFQCDTPGSIPDNTAACFFYPGAVGTEPTSWAMVKASYR